MSRSRRARSRGGALSEAAETLLILTVDFLLARVQHFAFGEEHEVVTRGGLAAVAPEGLTEQATRPVARHRRAQLAAHRQPHPVEAAVVDGGHQPEEPSVEAGASTEDPLELGPAVEAVPGPEPLAEPAHARPG
jgi:hypothetical protein